MILHLITTLAVAFSTYFSDATLRLDYIFSGNATTQEISFLEAFRSDVWAGRRSNLDAALLESNGMVTVQDAATGTVIYRNGFSTLFQEWQVTEEAKSVTKGFECCLQVPWPKKPVDISVTLKDHRNVVRASLKHRIDPNDILIRPLKPTHGYRQILGGGNFESRIDIVIVGDGYTREESAKFYSDAARVSGQLMKHEPFASNAGRFNFVALALDSEESGVSEPGRGRWKNTALSSHYDTFYQDRYLTSSNMRTLYDALAGVPFEHVIILVNTPRYGGGGIYNSLTVAAADNPTTGVVLVHEFGHAFAGLADEYAYDDEQAGTYPGDIEPWEPNITTLTDFGSKWQDMVPEGVKIPTPVDEMEKRPDIRRIWNTLPAGVQEELNRKVGVYEGGGYRSKGIYRPVQECRMRMNECEHFCPVCTRAIQHTIDYYTGN